MLGRRRSDDDERQDRPLRLFRERRRAGQPTSAQSCEHLTAFPAREFDRPPGCDDHGPGDGPVVHLRLCLTCGHVGCCDSSAPRHATVHAANSGHPVMQSAEPGEPWRWCYVHELLG
jgi:Zn-finger in ubiquitin-hydrolases and other protein